MKPIRSPVSLFTLGSCCEIRIKNECGNSALDTSSLMDIFFLPGGGGGFKIGVNP